MATRRVSNKNKDLAADDSPNQASAPSSAVQGHAPAINGADDAEDDVKIPSSADNPLKQKAAYGADGADDSSPHLSGTGGSEHTCVQCDEYDGKAVRWHWAKGRR